MIGWLIFLESGQSPAIMELDSILDGTYVYRDKEQREIDLLIEQNGVLYPVEFKKTSHPGKEVLKNFAALENLNLPIGHGAVVSLADKHIPLTDHVDVVPITYL